MCGWRCSYRRGCEWKVHRETDTKEREMLVEIGTALVVESKTAAETETGMWNLMRLRLEES